jgi:hypothetical protein
MHAPIRVGIAAPRIVHGCTIKNDSAGSVKVRISYEEVSREGEDVHHDFFETDIPMGETFRVEERLFSMGSYQIRKTINSIQVTRADGRIQKLTAPFDGVTSPHGNWLFVIDDSQIKSTK